MQILYTTDPDLPEEQWQKTRSGGPDAKTVTLPDLEEKRDYTIRVRGHNIHGAGLPGPDFKVTTWLAREYTNHMSIQWNQVHC